MTAESWILEDRVAQLDGPHAGPAITREQDPLDSDIRHFIRTLSSVTPVGKVSLGALPVIPAHAADEIVAGCNLIGRVQAERPEVATGPIDLNNQYWISAERPSHLTPRQKELDRRHFEEFGGNRIVDASTKPFDLGLFTSTGSFDSFGMWWSYLQENRGSTLFPEPWHVWHVDVAPASRVLEISTAARWAELASQHPIENGMTIYPDWAKISERWDGVHLAMRAIAATQGICLSLDDAVVAPTYWDVESTLWLRWVFVATTLIGDAAS